MTSSEGIVTSLTISNLLLFSLVVLIVNIFRKIWWIPTRLQKLMASQGIKGPSYTLIHGNNKEVANMYREAMSKPLDLSHDIVPLVLPHIHAWSSIYGKNFLQWQGTQAQLVVMEPELLKEIFNNKNGAFLKPTSEIPKILLGNGLPLLEGEKWAKSRKLANHTFHGESLKNMIPQMIVSAETMVGRWKDHVGQEIEVFHEFRLLTAEVISRTAFGSSYLQGQDIFKMLMKLSSLLATFHLKLKLPVISKFLKSSDEIEALKLQKGIRNSVMEIVKEREKKATSGGEESFGSDFLGALLKAYHDTNDKQRFSIDDIVDECKSFYFAGQETVNTLLAWTVFLLAVHTDWQEEVRKEVLELFGKETPNPNDLSKLKTMSMIINETLMLYSPIIYVTRSIERNVRLGKLLVPAEVELLIPFLAIHHDLQFWGQDAPLFKPERFSEGVAKATNNNMATFLPFGMGLGIVWDFTLAPLKSRLLFQ